MDALARLAPVARPLLRDVDNALATLGAPAEHRVWGLLRRVGTTPADAVTFFVNVDPDRLRAARVTLRDWAMAYEEATVPVEVPWEGSAAQVYAAAATALRAHLHGGADESMASRLRANASYVDSVADWVQQSRDELARVVARVLTSSQAVTVRSVPSLGRGLAEVMRSDDLGDGLARAVAAAADIGAAVLGVAEDAVVAGRDLHLAAAPALAELSYRPPAQLDPVRHEATIRLQHWR
jgi:hypothetical protein